MTTEFLDSPQSGEKHSLNHLASSGSEAEHRRGRQHAMLDAVKALGMIALANKEGGYDGEDQQAVEALSAAFVEALYHKRDAVALAENEDRYRRLTEAVTDYASKPIDRAKLIATIRQHVGKDAAPMLQKQRTLSAGASR